MSEPLTPQVSWMPEAERSAVVREVEPLLLDRPHAAKVLSIGKRTLDALVQRGLIRPTRIPGVTRTLFHADELKRFARSCSAGQGAAP